MGYKGMGGRNENLGKGKERYRSGWRGSICPLYTTPDYASNRIAPVTVVKVRGQGGSAPCSGLRPPAVNEKCYFMHKMCQILHPIDASVP